MLSLAYVTFMDELDRVMDDAGFGDFGPWHGFVLRALEGEPMSLRALAERLEMTSPGALKIVERMVTGGYLARGRHPSDRRVRLIGLTERGRSALLTARRFHAAFEADLGKRRAAAARAALTLIVERGSSRVPRMFRRP